MRHLPSKIPASIRRLPMRVTVVLALALVCGGAGAAPGRPTATPEQVVRAFADAWSNGDLPGLLASFADDGRSYDRPTQPHALTGALSRTIGSKAQLAAYFKKELADPPLSRERILATATVGDLVIASGESIDPPDSARGMRFLTAYRVRDGQIHDLWHIAWIPADAPAGPDPTEVIRQLIAANNARDADRFLALFSPDAKNFRHSDDPHRLADTPSRTVVDAASRERFFREYFAGTPVQVESVKLFSVGDLVVEQSHVSGFSNAPGKTVNEVSIYRIRDGRIVDSWLLGEETVAMPARGASANAAETVVLKDFETLSTGDVEGLAAVFAPQFAMYGLPTAEHALAGRRSDKLRTREELRAYFRTAFVEMPPARHEVLDMVSLGEYVLVRVAVHMPDGTPPDHAFTAFRVRDGLIDAIWHIAREPDAASHSGTAALAVIEQLVAAHNRGDADAFVALYHPDAKHSHSRHDPTQLGGAPAQPAMDQAGRKRFYRELYAKGAPTQVDIVGSAALGEWVATRERYAATADNPAREHLSIYRVRDGVIVHDWHVAP
jgi:hypothetical protein